ncbi:MULTISPECIES: hypothetical protein [Helicobacter]|uniref:hypothetical protein n=1 Tax=Helicobacter TaxID=209 RepID=UPI000EABCAC0|nr:MULTISPECIES: hypothetical protein [Helicobacter]
MERNARMRRAILGLLVPLVFVLGGCHRLNMGYFSEVRGDYAFNYNAPIVVVHDKEDMVSSYYLQFIIYQLQQLGFYNVFKPQDYPISQAKNTIYVQVVRNIMAQPVYTYDYTLIERTKRHRCYWHEGQFYCAKVPTNYYAISGFSASSQMLAGSHFIMDWWDNVRNKRVLYIDGSVSGKTCGYNRLYEDLIGDTIKRIDFTRSEHYRYYQRLPVYMPCYKR